jgi:hypothetical protein
MFLLWEVLRYGSVQSVQLNGFGTQIEVDLGMVFEVDFRFLFVVSRSYAIVCTTDFGHRK